MRNLGRGLLLMGLACFAWAGQLKFVSPTLDLPEYLIRLQFEAKTDGAVIKEIQLLDGAYQFVQVSQAGKPVDWTKPLSKGVFDIAISFSWKNKKLYTAAVLFQPGPSRRLQKVETRGLSPDTGGIPEGCEEGFYRIFRIEEDAGVERRREVASFTLTAPKTDLEKGSLRLYDGDTAVPFQVLGVGESSPPESAAKTHPPTLTYKLAVPLDAGPRQKKLLRIFKGEAAADAGPGIVVSGENLGKTVRARRLALAFHPQSGQIDTVEYTEEKIKLFNKVGVVHWNPDVFIPGIGWDHSFSWNPPEVFEEKQGGLMYISSRRGPMGVIKDVTLEVKYIVEKDAPYFLSETRMIMEKDLGVIAVRNDEMVLYKELFDTLIYRDKNGGVVRLPLQPKADGPFGLAHIAAPDIPWAGLVNSRENYGFFSLHVESVCGNPAAPGEFHHKPGIYFYAPSDGEYVYWVRPLIYTWGDIATNNLFSFVPKGSFFYEKNAYILLKMNERTPGELDGLLLKLRNPLRIF